MMRLMLLAALLAGVGAAAPLGAEVTPTDLQVAARALSFMEKPLTGALRVGIVYAPDSPRSRRQAEDIEKLLGAGLRSGNVEMRPTLVSLAEVGAANVDFYFLTEFVGERPALAALKSRPCVTTDLDQVRRGMCLMGVRSSPRVQIVVNRAAAQESGISFATIFRVMITEI
jgi:hypothetical protein